MQRRAQLAVVEPGENWVNETLNGEHFTLDEADHDWVLPTTGVLALDYVTFAAKYEAAYELDLSDVEYPAGVLGGFGWSLESSEPVELFLDDIRWE